MNKCPVCGYNDLEEPPYDEYGYGSYEICPSCGFQYGYDDDVGKELAIKSWREEWIKSGCMWYSKGISQPIGWNPLEQLKNI